MYGVLYGGVAVLISSTIGTWSSRTIHKSVLRLFQFFVLPVIIICLFIIALLCFIELDNCSKHVENSFDDLNTSFNKDQFKIYTETQLLVGGILVSYTCLFQSISFVATWFLFNAIESVQKESENLKVGKQLTLGLTEKNLLENNLNTKNAAASQNLLLFLSDFALKNIGRLYMISARHNRDKMIIAWASIMGLFYIFIIGNYVIFSQHISRSNSKHYWQYILWKKLGKFDGRYVNSDGYMVSSYGFEALIIGPLLLFFAWSTFVMAPYRFKLVAKFFLFYVVVLCF
jgi:hypothetical protein